MLDKKISVLFIDNDPSFTVLIEGIASQISDFVLDIEFADALQAAIKLIHRKTFDVIFFNLVLPDSHGLQTLINLKEKVQDVPLIVIVDAPDMEQSIDAIHEGASDYLAKRDINGEMFYRQIHYALERGRMNKILNQKNKELDRIRLRYQAILRSTPNGLCIINPFWKILWANAALNKIIYPQGGISHSSSGESFSVLFPKEEEFANVTKMIRESFQKSDIFTKEMRLVKGDGSPIIAEVSIVRIDPAETGGGYVATFVDVTARKKDEEALKKAQLDLIQSEKMSALGRFSSGIAHEIRNPLANIVSSAQYCLGKQEGRAAPIEEYLEIILRNAQNANRIIKSLLDFAKPRQIPLLPGNVEHVLKNVCDSVKAQCAKQNVQMKLVIPIPLPVASINETQLEEAFLNVISNSLAAMLEGGHLLIQAFVSSQDSQIIVKIADTGSGIMPEHINQVFEPFFTTRQEGVGLGMCMVEQIIKGHGGSISISSCPGKITEVKARLPLL